MENDSISLKQRMPIIMRGKGVEYPMASSNNVDRHQNYYHLNVQELTNEWHNWECKLWLSEFFVQGLRFARRHVETITECGKR